MASRLTSFPPELRLQIWELLLSPAPKQVNDDNHFTTVSRMCSAQLGTIYRTAVSHDWNNNCSCNVRSFYLLDNNKPTCPAILRVNQQIYHEALPYLYRDRTFTADPNRTYETLHDRICDSWFLMDQFLAGLSEAARSNVRSIKVSMLLSKFEVYGSRQAFYSIVSRLPALESLHLEVCPTSIRESSDDLDHLVTNHPADMTRYWLGPVMAFANVSILKIVASDKNDSTTFGLWKKPIEVSVWQQLLPLRFKRERRKIASIRRTLANLEYADCAGLKSEELDCD